MENCLEDMDLRQMQNLDLKLQFIYISLNEFSLEHCSLQLGQQDNLFANSIDEDINRIVTLLNAIYNLMLKKLNLNFQNKFYSQPVSQPAISYESQLEISKESQKVQTIQKIQKRKFILRDKHRGPYRSYSREEKNHVVMLHMNGMSFASISKELGIPQKNVVRWCREGYMERESNKRLADFEMEKTLCLWLQSQPQRQLLCYSNIQGKALALSSNPQFKASRGWLKNFLKRYYPQNDKLAGLKIKIQNVEND